MRLLGRESFSPHSIDNALHKKLYEFARAFKVMPDQSMGLKHFSSHNLLTVCTEFANLPLPVLPDRMEDVRIPYQIRASYLDVDPVTASREVW